MDTCTCEESANEKTVSKEDQVEKEGNLQLHRQKIGQIGDRYEKGGRDIKATEREYSNH